MNEVSLDGGGSPTDWRTEILHAVLRVAFVLGVVVGGVSIVYSARVGEWAVVVGDLVAIAVMAFLVYDGRLTYRQRAVGFLTVVYGLATLLLFEIGIVAHVYLLGFALLAALMLGLRAGIVAVVIDAVTLVGLALVADRGPTVDMGGLGSTGSRLMVIFNFLFVCVLLVVTCATLLDRLEEAFHEQRRAQGEALRLARVIEQTSDVVLLADATGRVEYANRAHEQLVERLGDDVRFTHLDQLGALARADDEPIATAHRDGEWSGTLVMSDHREAEQLDAGKVEFDASVEAVHAPDGSVANLVATLQDVTTTRSLERRLRRAEKLEALGTVASGIAHDFNNIVGAILGVAEELQRTLDDDPRRADADLIVEACDRARDVVGQMMVFGRRTTFDQVPVVVADVVRSAKPLLRAAIGTSVEIVEEVRGTGAVRSHPGSLSQVIVNLVTNAAQAMAGRGGRVTIRVTDIVADDDLTEAHPTLVVGRPHVLLSVIDNGPGIDPAHLDRIFDPFFTTKSPHEGTGLGLASVHAIVSALGGDIGVYSEVGVGTAFRVFLPAAEEVRAESPTAGEAATIGDREPFRILVVDDEPTILLTVARSLELAGHTVIRAVDGFQARELFDAAPDDVDVVVTDLTMPRLGGLDLIRHIRSVRQDLPVVLTSGFGEDQSNDVFVSLGLTAYLVKPFSRGDLLAVLDNLR